DVPPTVRTGRDEVPLIQARLEVEPAEVLRLVVATERATQTGERPRSVTDVAVEPPAPVLEDVGEARRRPAEGAHPERPIALGEVRAAAREVGLQPRTQRRHGDERNHVVT